MRLAARIDDNQRSIVDAMRDIPGVTVALNHHDILVGYKGKTYWYEIKNPAAVSKRTGKIKDTQKKKSQVKLENEWTGHYRIVSTLDEILVDMMLRNK